MSSEGKIAYSSPRTGHGDIYSVDLFGNRERLTVDWRFESQPVFAPDSSIIAFVRESRSCRHVWLMSKEGKGQGQLTSGAVLDDIVEFSANGAHLLVSRGSAIHGLGRLTSTYLVDLQDRARRDALIGDWASFSPDSKHLVYGPTDHSDEVWIMDIDGGNRRKIGSGQFARYSPDSYSLVLTRDSDQIWNMSTNGSNPKHLANGRTPVFTPNGTHIVYVAEKEIWSVNSDGTNNVKIKAPSGEKYLARSPSAVGLAFRLVNLVCENAGSIWLLRFDTWEVQQIDTMSP